MSRSQLATIEEELEAGRDVTIGVLPRLTPLASYYVQLWSDLRSSTPGDQPIALQSIHLTVGDHLHQVVPMLRGMDRVLFECVRDRREADRQRAEDKAKAAQQRRGRR